MTDLIRPLFMVMSLFVVGGLAWLLFRVVNSASNDLEWSDLVSTRGRNDKQYADWNKIGQGGGVILSMWLPIAYANSKSMDGTGLASVMGVALLYLGGVSSYAATLRSKRGSIETTRTVETGPVSTATEVTTQTAPIAAKDDGS